MILKKYRASMRIIFRAKVIEKLSNADTCTFETSSINYACLEKYIENQIQCKIPWTYPDTNNDQYRLCSSAKDLKKIVQAYPEPSSMTPREIRQLLLDAKCAIKCQTREYSIRQIKKEVYEMKDFPNPYLHLGIDLSEKIQSLEKEVIMFDIWSLLSYVGGFAGLLIGYSLLTFVEIGAGQLEKLLQLLFPSEI